MKVKSESEVTQSCPTLSDPMVCSLPGSSVRGIFQARVLECVAIAFSLTNLDSVLKSRDITLLTKVHKVRAMIFPVVKYRCESWTIKEAEHQRTDAFELWYWRRFLGVSWTARRSNQSIVKNIIPEYSLEGLMLKPKLQHFFHLMQRANSLDNMLGKVEGSRRRQGQRMRWLDFNIDSMDDDEFEQVSLSKLWEIVKDREAWCTVVHVVGLKESGMTERLNTSNVLLY